MSHGSARCGTTGLISGAGSTAAVAAGAATRAPPPAPATANAAAAAVPEPRKDRRENWRLTESFMLKSPFDVREVTCVSCGTGKESSGFPGEEPLQQDEDK